MSSQAWGSVTFSLPVASGTLGRLLLRSARALTCIYGYLRCRELSERLQALQKPCALRTQKRRGVTTHQRASVSPNVLKAPEARDGGIEERNWAQSLMPPFQCLWPDFNDTDDMVPWSPDNMSYEASTLSRGRFSQVLVETSW